MFVNFQSSEYNFSKFFQFLTLNKQIHNGESDFFLIFCFVFEISACETLIFQSYLLNNRAVIFLMDENLSFSILNQISPDFQ